MCISDRIPCGILFWFADQLGASLVQSFSAALAIGVVTSMFSAIVITRTLLRVIASTNMSRRVRLFVPAAGAVLADWGADVIKIEHPVSGDGQRGLVASGLIPGDNSGVSFMMEQSNRGKRSVGLDLATERGRKILYRLAESSDVFLTNFLTPARRKLAIDLADIRAVNPDTVPYTHLRAHETLRYLLFRLLL